MSTGELASSSQKTPAQRLRTKFWHLTGKSRPGRARALAHAHPAVQECERLRQQVEDCSENREPSSPVTRMLATSGNALASWVSARDWT